MNTNLYTYTCDCGDMEDYESDIDEEFLDKLVEDIEDPELSGEINAALGAVVEYEIIDTPEDESEDEDEELHDVELDDISVSDQKVDSECESTDDSPGESVITSSKCTKKDKIQIREMLLAHESRMPDVPTWFELGGLIISRACTLAANSTPLVPFEVFDPAKIARKELIHGKALRAVMRGDTLWRWSDFTCFPRGFMNEDETADVLHEMQ